MGSDQKANYTQMEEELELEQYGVWVKTGPEEIPLDDSDLGTENFDLEDLDIPEESSISDISEEEEQLLDDLQFEDDGGLEEEELTPSEALEDDQEEVFDLDLDFDESLNLEEDSSLPNHIDDLEDDPFSLDSLESIAQEPEEIPAAEIMDSDFGDFEELSLEGRRRRRRF
jgi:pilus assembly protein FimV